MNIFFSESGGAQQKKLVQQNNSDFFEHIIFLAAKVLKFAYRFGTRLLRKQSYRNYIFEENLERLSRLR